MLATVQGDLAGSSTAPMTPWLVVILSCLAPDFCTPLTGGVPTFFRLVLVVVSAAVQAQSLGTVGGLLKPPAAQITPTTASTSTTPPPMPACHWRRRPA